MSSNDKTGINRKLDNTTSGFLEKLAWRFPVCTSSDEFHFFPQVPLAPARWSCWDDFSRESIMTVRAQFVEWQQTLTALETPALTTAQKIDLRMMRRVLKTLHEQFSLMAFHQTQPTFYLTIMGIGLADAIDAGPWAFQQRLRGLPAFLEQARCNLARVPGIFNRMGQAMAKRLSAWLRAMPAGVAETGPALTALDRLVAHLIKSPAGGSFLPSTDVYARIVSEHIGCRINMAELEYELDSEIAATSQRLQHCAERIAPGRPWQAVVNGLKRPDAAIRPARHFRRTIDALAQHCVDQGLISSAFPRHCPVKVEAIPDYMSLVRSNAAFSAAPGHPARGGTFFIANNDIDSLVPADYRLLTAHETYPGHHVLDSFRWNHDRPLRRHIEFPLFYEGWASFCEELLFETGFFSGPVDKLLVAKRRFWRALRGRVDFNINMRQQNLTQAAGLLSAHGMDPARAKAMVARYILKPGYQLAYTIGRRKFRRLYQQFSSSNKPADFTCRVLSQGEIEFDELETVLMQGG